MKASPSTIRLRQLGFTDNDIRTLKRAERALHRWDELCCGFDRPSGSSVRVEFNEKKECWERIVYSRMGDLMYSTPVRDGERAALKRVQRVLAQPHISIKAYYRQTDPRGCALYLIPASVILQHKDDDIESFYNEGIAIC